MTAVIPGTERKTPETAAPDEVRVSVVLAVKNESRYIASALGSILEQKGVSFEVILVDDGSTDDTYAQAEALARSDGRLRVLRNPRKGKVAAFNTGVEMARGAYVCLFAGDDIMPPGSLAARLEAVRSLPEDRPGAGLSKIRTLCEDPRFDGKIVPRAKGKGNPSGQSPLMNRKAAELLFPVPEVLPNEDTWLEIAVLHTGQVRLVHSDVVCCHWRMHAGNSYNMTLGFAAFKERIVRRLNAYSLFCERFAGRLTPSEEAHLAEMVKCNRHYAEGDIFGLLRGRIGLVSKLRLLGTINPTMYGIRRRFFGLLSGW